MCWQKKGGKPDKVTGKQTKKPDKGGKDKKQGACHNCNKIGHFKAECRQPVGVAGAAAGEKDKKEEKMDSVAGMAVLQSQDPPPSTFRSSSILQCNAMVSFVCNASTPRAREKGDEMAVDSGATGSLFSNPEVFDFINPRIEYVQNANKDSVPMVQGTGTARMIIDTDQGKAMLVIEDAKYAPGCWDLQSQSQLKSKGHQFTDLTGQTFKWILPSGATVLSEDRGGLYRVPYTPAGKGGFDRVELKAMVAEQQHLAMLASTKALPADLWHEQLGHCNLRDVVRISKVTDGINVREAVDIDILGDNEAEEDEDLDICMTNSQKCETYAIMKAKHQPHNRN